MPDPTTGSPRVRLQSRGEGQPLAAGRDFGLGVATGLG